MAVVTIGIDVGQRVDPTALAVAEQQMRPRVDKPGVLEDHFVIRHLERLALDTPYPKVAARLGNLVQSVRTLGAGSPTLYVDATGVGQPVVDVLRANLGATEIVAVYFSHGDRRTVEDGAHGKEIRLGKAWLVSRLQALLQTGRLHLPNTQEAKALADELQVYEIRIDENANDKYGAFKVGTHDDLVTALGLATQEAAGMPALSPLAHGSTPIISRRGAPAEWKKSGFR